MWVLSLYMEQILKRSSLHCSYLMTLPQVIWSEVMKIGIICNILWCQCCIFYQTYHIIPAVVGLYLLGQWWGVEDVLKTAESSRTGLIEVSVFSFLCKASNAYFELVESFFYNYYKTSAMLIVGQHSWGEDSPICSQQNCVEKWEEQWRCFLSLPLWAWKCENTMEGWRGHWLLLIQTQR